MQKKAAKMAALQYRILTFTSIFNSTHWERGLPARLVKPTQLVGCAMHTSRFPPANIVRMAHATYCDESLS